MKTNRGRKWYQLKGPPFALNYFTFKIKGSLLFKGTPTRENYQLCLSVGFLLTILCRGRAKDVVKPHILALAAEFDFLQVKEQVPFKIKNKYQRFYAKRRPFD